MLDMYVAALGPVLSLVIPTLGQIVSCKLGFKRTDDLIVTIFNASFFLHHEEAIGCECFFRTGDSL